MASVMASVTVSIRLNTPAIISPTTAKTSPMAASASENLSVCPVASSNPLMMPLTTAMINSNTINRLNSVANTGNKLLATNNKAVKKLPLANFILAKRNNACACADNKPSRAAVLATTAPTNAKFLVIKFSDTTIMARIWANPNATNAPNAIVN